MPQTVAFAENIVPALASDPDLYPERSQAVRNMVYSRIFPGALGRGASLENLIDPSLETYKDLHNDQLGELSDFIDKALAIAIHEFIVRQEYLSPVQREHGMKAIELLIDVKNRQKQKISFFRDVVNGKDDFLLSGIRGGDICLGIGFFYMLTDISPRLLGQCFYRLAISPYAAIAADVNGEQYIEDSVKAVFGEYEYTVLDKVAGFFVSKKLARYDPPVTNIKATGATRTRLALAEQELLEWKTKQKDTSVMNAALPDKPMMSALQAKALEIYERYNLRQYSFKDRYYFALLVYDHQGFVDINNAIEDVYDVISKTPGCIDDNDKLTPKGFHVLSGVYSKLEMRGTLFQNSALRFVVDHFLCDFIKGEKRVLEMQWLLGEFDRELAYMDKREQGLDVPRLKGVISL